MCVRVLETGLPNVLKSELGVVQLIHEFPVLLVHVFEILFVHFVPLVKFWVLRITNLIRYFLLESFQEDEGVSNAEHLNNRDDHQSGYYALFHFIFLI